MKNKLEAIFVSVTFVILLFFSSYGFLFYGYPLTPGDDIGPHLQFAYQIQHGQIGLMEGYPHGFHLLVSWVSHLFGGNLISGINFISILLLPLSALAVWYLARTLFGRKAGLVSLFLYAFIAWQPFQTWTDGSLPNILAIGVIFPLLIASLVKWFQKKNWQRVSLVIVLLIALILTHHLSALILVASSVVFVIFLSILMAFKSRNLRNILSWLVGGLLIAWFLMWIFFHAPFLAPARSIFNNFLQPISGFPYFKAINTADGTPWIWSDFGTSLSGWVFSIGILGWIIQLWMQLSAGFGKGRLKAVTAGQLGGLYICAWFFVYYFGASQSWTGEPSRLARDLVLPACILGGWVMVYLFDLLHKFDKKAAWAWVLIPILVWIPAINVKYIRYTEKSKMVRFSKADQAAYAYIFKHKLEGQTYVMAKSGIWDAVVLSRGDQGKLKGVLWDISLKDAPQDASCYLAGWYYEGVWPPQMSDQSHALTFVTSPNLKEKAKFSDYNKEWHLMCKL